MAPLLSSILRLISLAICAIAIGWFVGFAVEQSKKASAHQQAEMNKSAELPSQRLPGGEPQAPSKPSGLHEAIDKAFSTVSSPFSGLTNSLTSPWTQHIVDTLLALLIYGLGLGFLARQLRLAR